MNLTDIGGYVERRRSNGFHQSELEHDEVLRLVAIAEAAMEKMDAEDQHDAAVCASGKWSERTSKARTEEGRASAKLRATLAGVTR